MGENEMSDPDEAAALLQAPPGWSDSDDLDAQLRSFHLPAQVVADWYRGRAEKLAEAPGLVPEFAEAASRAAAAISAAAEELEAVTGGGIMGRARRGRPFDPQGQELTRWLSARDPHWQNGNERRSWTG